MMAKIKMGMMVEDRVSGFKGIVTGKAEYITGCTQFLVNPGTNKDGNLLESIWFDKGRLEIVDDGISGEIAQKDTGGPMRDAPRRKV